MNIDGKHWAVSHQEKDRKWLIHYRRQELASVSTNASTAVKSSHDSITGEHHSCSNIFERHSWLYINKKHLKNVGPIHHNEPPHAHSADVASGTVARRLNIDVYDANDDDDDNDNA